jgi:SAM-dependent methyltransferase
VAGGHPQPGHPVVLRRLTGNSTGLRDNAAYYGPEAARWYDAVNAWRTEDVGFYLREAGAWAGPGGAALELAAGQGRVALPLARAGFRVTALESAPAMLEALRARVSAAGPVVGGRIEVVEGDMRRFELDRLYRFIYLPFNTLLMLSQPHERQRLLERVREHLAPSGGFAFDIFTPDPGLIRDQPEWVMELDFETDDPAVGRVRVQRETRASHDLGRQVKQVQFRHRVLRGGAEIAAWEDELELALVFPRELELLLERQGFRIRSRHGGPGGEPYAPTPGNVQPMYVVAQLMP